MTQEDKELLLKDLCARLTYGVKISKVTEDYISEPKTPRSINVDGCIVVEDEPFDDGTPDIDYWYISEVKPYLRPMPSMTEEELKELSNKFDIQNYYGELRYYTNKNDFKNECDFSKLIDWLNVHHIDFHNLIGKGLALEAHEGMY